MGAMRGQATTLAVALIGLAAWPIRAQSDAPVEETEGARTAEQFIETAQEAYSVREERPEPCPQAVGNEIVVCRQLEDPDKLRVPSPTERAYAAGERPPDPIPNAPDVFGLPPCSAYMFCSKVGRTPPPVLIIDLSKIPEALTPEEAALVFRVEDPPSPEEASPAAAP